MEFKSLVNQLDEIFPRLGRQKLESMDDCISWFKDYKKRIKSFNQEWFYCKFVLKSLNLWNSNLTKNQAYLLENSTLINGLYKEYVLPQGNKYNPQGRTPSLKKLIVDELKEGCREEDI